MTFELRSQIFSVEISKFLNTDDVSEDFFGGFVVDSKTNSKSVPRKYYPRRVNSLLVIYTLNPKKSHKNM